MIIEPGGGKGGFKEYLETGQKKGRELHRDQLDQRIPLIGDLDVFEIATSLHQGEGRLYDHITLSLTERHVSDQMLQVLANEFRDHALSAWPESERHRVAIYAEAHRPKILSYKNSETGKYVDRLIHVHFGIGRHDLLTGKSIEPLGFLGERADNLKFIDAFQESFNSRYGFASPKDNPKITPENAVDTLARYTGARPNALGTFNERKAALEVALQKEIISRNITTWDGFEKLLAGHGEVSKMHEGKFNECYRVKPHGATKAMRLSGVFFTQQFIERPTPEKQAIISEKAKVAYLEQMQPRKEPEYIAGVLNEWRQTKARELRFLHTGSSYYKNTYLPADAETRRQILDDLERKSLGITPCIVPDLSHLTNKQLTKGINHVLRIAPNGGVPPNPGKLFLHAEPDRTLPPPHRRGSLHELSTGDLDGDGSIGEVLLPYPLHVHMGDERPRQDQNLRRAGTSTASSRGSLKTQPSSVIARLNTDLRERYEQAADKEKFAEIRKNLDCSQLLASLSHSHGLNPDLYKVAAGKDGTPRIQCGSRALTPSDFLTKELGLPWREAAPILSGTYARQIGSKVVKPRPMKAAPSKLWREFKAELQAGKPGVSNRIKLFNEGAKVRRTALFKKLNAEQNAALDGLTGHDRKVARSLQKLRMATAKAEFKAMLEDERSSIQPTQANAWRIFLQTRAQVGSEEALAELRKLDDSARAAQPTGPSFTGTIILDDSEEKKRRRHTGDSAAVVELLRAITPVVSKNSDITYQLRGQSILRDEGRHLAVLDENSEDAIVAGLLLAREKFGSNLTLTGSADFQRRAVEVAVANGISVKFTDPQLEAMRLQLVSEKRQAERPVRTPKPVIQPVEVVRNDLVLDSPTPVLQIPQVAEPLAKPVRRSKHEKLLAALEVQIEAAKTPKPPGAEIPEPLPEPVVAKSPGPTPKPVAAVKDVVKKGPER